MKTSKKILIVGFILLAVSLLLVILGGVIFTDKEWTLGWKPNFALFVPGMFGVVFSIPFIMTGFMPQIAKIQSKLHSETLDYAGKDISEASKKSVDVSESAIDKTVKIVQNAIKEDSMFCANCGAKIDKNSKFCKNCGQKQ